jgi:uncharacterized protein (TIGR00251 family)
MAGFFRETGQGVRISVLIQPGAARDEILGPVEDRLKIRLTAPPQEGRANKALIKLLAKRLKAAPSRISILKGHKSRRKELLVEGLGLEEATRLLRGVDG